MVSYLTKRSHCKIDIKSFNPQTGIFTGYASKFNNLDLGGDIVIPGAYKKTVLENRDSIKFYYNHAKYPGATPIGKVLEIVEDEKGLKVKCQLFYDTDDMAKKIYRLLQEGVLQEMSIGYDIIKDEYNEKGHHILKELRLYEVSVVDFAMNPQARIQTVKRIGNDGVKAIAGFQEMLSNQEYQRTPFMYIDAMIHTINDCLYNTGTPDEKYQVMRSSIGQFAQSMLQWLDDSYNRGLLKEQLEKPTTKEIIKENQPVSTGFFVSDNPLVKANEPDSSTQCTQQAGLSTNEVEINSLLLDMREKFKKLLEE